MNIKQYIQGESVNDQVEQFISITTFTNQIRIERGISFYYLWLSPNSTTTLLQQQSQTNQILQNILPILKTLPFSQIGPILSKLENLSTIQNEILNQTKNFSGTIQWFSDLNDGLYAVLTQLVFVEDILLAKELKTMLYLHCYFDWIAKESITIAGVLVTGMMKSNFCNEYWSIRQSQSIFFLQAQLCAPSDVVEFVVNLSDPSYLFAITNIENTRKYINELITTNTPPPPSLTAATNWWSNVTVILDSTDIIDTYIKSDISAAENTSKSENLLNMILAIIGSIFEGMAAVQLTLVAMPIFCLAFAWRTVNKDSKFEVCVPNPNPNPACRWWSSHLEN